MKSPHDVREVMIRIRVSVRSDLRIDWDMSRLGGDGLFGIDSVPFGKIGRYGPSVRKVGWPKNLAGL